MRGGEQRDGGCIGKEGGVPGTGRAGVAKINRSSVKTR